MKDNRARAWTFVVYPDSAPENWICILAEEKVPFCVSPLHDRDINPTGEAKKSHYHVVMYFSGKKSFDQVCDISDSIKQPHPQYVNDLRGMVRYLAHLDNPEKAQYSKLDIRSYCGFDASSYLALGKFEKYDMIAQMLDFIDSNNILEISSFSNYCRSCRRSDWWPMFCDYNRIFDTHIRSLRNALKDSGCNFK